MDRRPRSHHRRGKPRVPSVRFDPLAADPDTVTTHDIASEATWADEIKSDRSLRQRTSKWHYIDIGVSNPNVDQACFNHPPLPGGTAAFNGPADDCILDKIDEFTAELASSATDPEERIVALKFLLHLVGDLHQPLHAADDNDRGGNAKRVSAPGMRPGNLHHYWDTVFVLALGPEPREVAAELIKGIPDVQAKAWAKGTPLDWAQESFILARDHVYGQLPNPNARGNYRLTTDYLEMANSQVTTQLSKAGVRLAFVLNTALGEISCIDIDLISSIARIHMSYRYCRFQKLQSRAIHRTRYEVYVVRSEPVLNLKNDIPKDCFDRRLCHISIGFTPRSVKGPVLLFRENRAQEFETT